MNFYSGEIINNIIDNSTLECIEPNINQFILDTQLLLLYLCKNTINFQYIQTLISHKRVKYAYRCIDTMFRISNCPSVMAYSCITTSTETIYYILLICTKHNFKNMGYASALLDDFIKKVKTRHSPNKITKIVLSSLDTAVTYYEKYGFVWTRNTLSDYPELLKYETYEEGKEYFIMELVV